MRNKTIKGFKNYCIYEDGRVKNKNTNYFLKGTIRLHGYLAYRLSKEGKKYQFYAHRLVAEAFIDNPLNFNIVNHKDGNKLNNHVNNLEWCDQSDNMKHAYQKQLISKRSQKDNFYGPLDINEKFVPIRGFTNYIISNYGRVVNTNTNRVLKPSIVCGYKKIRLSHNGKIKDFLIHYLVQEYFNHKLPSSNKECIDHIDGNKFNNRYDNLRVVTFTENANLAFYEQKLNNSLKPIDQYSTDGTYIQSFPSCREAGRKLGLDSSSIVKVIKGKRKTCGGFIFKESNL